jgi:hypothetical protein
MTPDDANALSLLFHRDTDKFATHILDKSQLLFETKPDTPLYISESPIEVLQFSLFSSQSSALDNGPFGTNKRRAAIENGQLNTDNGRRLSNPRESRDYLAPTTWRIMPSVFV